MATRDHPLQRIAETLHRGMRLFHDGMRDLAAEPLAAVLRAPDGHPAWRLAAAGLLAEVYRGKADFLRAEHYYRIGLAEADAIPPGQRTINEWYQHYRPRCALGLITALRRLLSPDHETILGELRTTRDLAKHVSIPDLSCQLGAVEGVYRRQTGDLDGSAGLLCDARDGMAALEGFCYWYPEHVEALLLQVQLLSISGRALVRRGARDLLDSPSVGSWSKAVAAACYLHLHLDRMTDRGATTAQLAEAAADQTRDGVGHLLDVLGANARAEGDPLLESEALVLRLAWRWAAGRAGHVAGIAEELLEVVTRAPPILAALRGCEVRVLASLFPDAAAGTQPAFATLARCGDQAVHDLRPSIATYGYDAGVVGAWAALLAPGGPPPHPSRWLDGPLAPLRCLAWP